MPISIVCHKCGQKLRAPDAAAGMTATCNKCQARLVVPSLAVHPDPTKAVVPPKPAEAEQAPPPVRRKSAPSTAAGKPPVANDASESDAEPYVLEIIPTVVKPYVVKANPFRWRRYNRIVSVAVVLGVAALAVALLGMCLMGVFFVDTRPPEIYPDGTETLSKHQVKENLKALARAHGKDWNGVDSKLPGVYSDNEVEGALGRWVSLWESEGVRAPLVSKLKAECTDGAILILETEVSWAGGQNFSFLVEIVGETNESLRRGIPYSKATLDQQRADGRWKKEHPEE